MKGERWHDPTVNGGASGGRLTPPPSGGGRETLASATGLLVDTEPRHPNGRKVRIDALPEYLEYRDSGCEVAPSCLRCPLVRCRYDEPGGVRSLLQTTRDEAVRRRRAEGVGIDALAREFGISRRSVFRILARGRAAPRIVPG